MERKSLTKKRFSLFAAMALSFAAIAGTISINAGIAPYNTVAAAQGIFGR